MIVLNSAVAEALIDFKKRVDARIPEFEKKLAGTKHTAKFHAIIEVLREDIKTCKPIRFDGNGYSEEWQKEAEKRGLDVENSCPIIFDRYLDEDSVKMFESMKVMTAKELAARNEIKWETYTKKIQIESRIFGDMALNQIIPVATKYQSSLIDNVCKLKTIFPAEKAEKVGANNLTLIERISEHSAYITDHVAKMIEERKKANRLECEREKAIAYHDNVAPMIEDIRKHIDELELIVDDQQWILPKYRELLFLR